MRKVTLCPELESSRKISCGKRMRGAAIANSGCQGLPEAIQLAWAPEMFCEYRIRDMKPRFQARRVDPA